MPNISLEQAKVLKSLLSISHDSNSQSLGAPSVTDIEDLHTLIEDRSKLDNLAISFPSTVKKARRILGLPTRSATRRVPSSAVVDAAISRRIEVRDCNIYRLTIILTCMIRRSSIGAILLAPERKT